MNRLLISAVLVLGSGPGAVGGEARSALRLSIPSAKVQVFERVEIEVLGVPAAANPFDPEEIAVDLEARPPSGKPIRLPGFFHREYERKLVQNREVLTPRGEGGWWVRFAPVEAGRHELEVTVAVKGLVAGKAAGKLEASPGHRRGFARLEPDGKRYFRFDDGTPLFLNGLCACWHDGRGTYDYDDWLWQDIHKANLYQHWSALAEFLKGTAIARPDMVPAKFEAAEGGQVKPLGVASGREALVWLLDPAFDWPAGAKEEKPAPVARAQVVLLGLEDGRYSTEWWDTLAGKRIGSAESESRAGRLTLAPPAFQVDIAGRLKGR